MRSFVLAGLVVASAAHSNLIYPTPRNAIDSLLPAWANGTAPYKWEPYGDAPCACTNGTSFCESAQTCLWFSVGCSIGCDACDGGAQGGANPNYKDRCPGVNPDKKTATVNNPLHRTVNRDAAAGSAADWSRFNPWRAPGSAPVYDPCGRASGGPHATGGHGEFTNTSFAHIGMLGSALPKFPSGAVWKAGAVVETMWSLRANHGGGYQYRLCKADDPLGLVEDCFIKHPLPFTNGQRLRWGGKHGRVEAIEGRLASDGPPKVGNYTGRIFTDVKVPATSSPSHVLLRWGIAARLWQRPTFAVPRFPTNT